MKRIFYTFSLSISFLLTGMDNSSIANVSAAHLMSAMENNDFLLAKQLLKINPKIVYQSTAINFYPGTITPMPYGIDTITPLHYSPNQEWSQFLIKHGAKVNTLSYRGLTLLDFVCMNPKKPKTSHALYLINQGATNHSDHYGDSLLHKIIKHNRDLAIDWIPFLLKHNITIHKQNNDGQTPFDLALLMPSSPLVSKNELITCFEKAGIMFFDKKDCNPYDLLKNDAHHFKKGLRNHDHTMECRLANLFMFIKKCEQKYTNNTVKYSPSAQGITINSYGYIFNHTTFNDLENWVGQNEVNYVKEHFKILYKKAKYALFILKDPNTFVNMINTYPFLMNYNKKLRLKCCDYMVSDMDLIYSYTLYRTILRNIKNINFVDHNGNNLLHRAVISNNLLLIYLLIGEEFNFIIDFTAKNNYNLTPLAIAKKYNKPIFIDTLYEGLRIKLHLVSQYDTYSEKVIQFLNEECDINRENNKGKTLLFKITKNLAFSHNGLFWCYFLLARSAKVNIQSHKKKPLLNKAIINLNDFLNYHPHKTENILTIIRLFLAKGAVITKTMLNLATNKKIKDLLQGAYDEQACCVCMENPVGMNEIPCNNTHKNSFLCEQCYNLITQQNNICPLCREQLNKYQAFK